MIYGSNLDVLGDKKQILQNATVQQNLQDLQLRILRVPVRVNADDASVKRAAQLVKGLGATMLVDLRGVVGTGMQKDATRVVQDMSQVFGQQAVYFEFGNEEDLQGLSADQYVSAWNASVPSLKQLAPQARFVGPVTYRYDAHYLDTFLRGARPLPDAVSWHEYPCDASQSSDQCLANLQDWKKHLADARQTMVNTLKTILPVMVTEWNYAANARPDDGKASDAKFLTTWTVQALQILGSNSVFASMQFSALDSATPLIDSASGNLTAQGTVLHDAYQQYLAAHPPSAPDGSATATSTALADVPMATDTPTATPTATATAVMPTDTPTPRPTPKPTPQPCDSHNWYLHPYGGTTGSLRLTTTPYCGGKILLTLTQVPAYMTQMRVCIVSGPCGSWVNYTSVGDWLTMYTGLSAGTVFYLQARDVNGDGYYVIYGTVKF